MIIWGTRLALILQLERNTSPAMKADNGQRRQEQSNAEFGDFLNRSAVFTFTGVGVLSEMAQNAQSLDLAGYKDF